MTSDNAIQMSSATCNYRTMLFMEGTSKPAQSFTAKCSANQNNNSTLVTSTKKAFSINPQSKTGWTLIKCYKCDKTSHLAWNYLSVKLETSEKRNTYVHSGENMKVSTCFRKTQVRCIWVSSKRSGDPSITVGSGMTSHVAITIDHFEELGSIE